jgi:hypothetical protein
VKKLLWGKAGALRGLTSGHKLSGADPGAIAFSMIQIVDVAANDFATEDIMVNEMEELPQLKQSALAKARPFFEQYSSNRAKLNRLTTRIAATLEKSPGFSR